jgi:hypothetical protein
MSAFGEQRRQIRGALVQAGLSPDAATQIANILGNSVQEMRHSGAVAHDSTPADFRMVGPEQRKTRFVNMDDRAADPDYRPQRVADSEEKVVSQPEPNVISVVAPQQIEANFRVANGTLTSVVGNGQAARVDVNNVVAARPPAGLPLTMLDNQANQLVGKAPRAQVGPNDGTARLDIQENNREVLWNLQMLNRADYDVVTKVEFVAGRGLEVTYKRIKAWDENRERLDTIPTVEQTVVSEVVDDKHGTYGRRRIIPAFGSVGQAPSYFNTYRIGTFTGGWTRGTTKQVTAVWPTSGTQVDVINRTQTVPNTPSTKYVLYGVRTRDSVPDLPVPPATTLNESEQIDKEADRPSTTYTAEQQYDVVGEYVQVAGNPLAEYYAIEIQNAEECTAFASLNGLLVTGLSGYDATKPSALSYALPGATDPAQEPCLMWRSHLVTVVTDVTLTTSGLVIHKKQLYVLAEEEADDGLIPVQDCPPSTLGE